MTTKTFDAVKLMRQIRDELSQEMASMTPDQRIAFIREKVEAADAAASKTDGDSGETDTTR